MDQEPTTTTNDHSPSGSTAATGSSAERTGKDGSESAVDDFVVQGKGSRVSLASPRFWHGMRFLTYWRLLWNGGFRVHFSAIGMAVAIFFFSLGNSLLSGLQWLLRGRKIARTSMDKPPVFIVGHWRSGTTLVHELMNLDEELVAPNTYQCFAPSHFLITEWLLKPVVGWLLPRTRPMDNMANGADRPQEDEFAICALGAPSPYLGMAFPNQPQPHRNLIDMVDVSLLDRQKLAEALRFFTQALTCKTGGKRLVLKSPTHTGRIAFLRELFPGAKFIHVCRNPASIIPSTVRLWTRLHQVNGFQLPRYEQFDLETDVGQTFRRMYAAFDAATQNQDDDVVTLAYEELLADPVASLQRAYQQLELDGFERLQPRIREYMQGQSDYQKNEYRLSDRLREIINESCQSYQEKYGYEKL